MDGWMCEREDRKRKTKEHKKVQEQHRGSTIKRHKLKRQSIIVSTFNGPFYYFSRQAIKCIRNIMRVINKKMLATLTKQNDQLNVTLRAFKSLKFYFFMTKKILKIVSVQL